MVLFYVIFYFLGGTNLANAVATSMNLTNSSEPIGEATASGHYKLEPSHDLMYYQNTTSELNQTDGFLSSILNDEELQLMDMAMNEGKLRKCYNLQLLLSFVLKLFEIKSCLKNLMMQTFLMSNAF